MNKLREEIIKSVNGKNPVIYINTSEENRISQALADLAPKCFPGGSLTVWSCVRGLEPDIKGADTRDPLAALEKIISEPKPGFYLMKDFGDFINDPRVTRGLREAYFSFLKNYKTAIVISSAFFDPPESIKKEIRYIEINAPSGEEIEEKVKEIEKKFPQFSIPEELRSKILLALNGLDLTEIEHIMYRVFNSGVSISSFLEEIFLEKGILTKKAGFLEFVPINYEVNAVGGLKNLREWAAKRKDLFNRTAVSSGMPIPKGVLIMGVSGCGKSLMAKSIAGLWNVPLFRLNMNMVFSGLYGTPGVAFHKALSMIEKISPAVLWIDEMESSFSFPKDSGTSQSMIFAEFLTWMQEKPPLVFVAATANRIELLPAELIRKGCFDEVFFCDLPSPYERYEILSIHLQKNGVDPKKIDINQLLGDTHGFSGAEIEQMVIGAVIEAYQKKRELRVQDIKAQIRNMVPLSTTMAEQVKLIRDWAQTRAVSAS
ncbi:MAG: AAA family ATPase [Elusimicrobiota bacterium]